MGDDPVLPTNAPKRQEHDHHRNGESDTRRHRRADDDTPESGIRITVPPGLSKHVVTLLVGGVVAVGGTAGVGASHSALSSKVDKVLEAQAREQVELATFEADVLARLKTLEKRDDQRPR